MSARFGPLWAHKWYKLEYSMCQANNCVFSDGIFYGFSRGTMSAHFALLQVHLPDLLFMQLKAAEQQHEQIGSSTGNAALASLQEKESAMQAIAMQLFNKRLQLMKENNSLEVKMPFTPAYNA